MSEKATTFNQLKALAVSSQTSLAELAQATADAVEEVDAKIPDVTEEDDGKFIRVQGGVLVAVEVAAAEEASF